MTLWARPVRYAAIIAALFQLARTARRIISSCDQQQVLNLTASFSLSRIANASFSLNGKTYQLFANSGSLNLHGGPQGFDKHKWSLVAEDECSVTLQYLSPDNDQGFPGELKVQIQFSVTDENELRIQYTATLADQSASVQTPVNLTNHSYWNLSGVYNAEASKILNHQVCGERLGE